MNDLIRFDGIHSQFTSHPPCLHRWQTSTVHACPIQLTLSPGITVITVHMSIHEFLFFWIKSMVYNCSILLTCCYWLFTCCLLLSQVQTTSYQSIQATHCQYQQMVSMCYIAINAVMRIDTYIRKHQSICCQLNLMYIVIFYRFGGCDSTWSCHQDFI